MLIVFINIFNNYILNVQKYLLFRKDEVFIPIKK